jgi:hypothetical protein
MSAAGSVRVYVNGRGIDVPATSSTLDAVRLADPAAADAVSAGTRALTDSRGLPAAIDAPVHGGAILRVVSARESTARDDA